MNYESLICETIYTTWRLWLCVRFDKNDYNNPQVSPGPFKDVTHHHLPPPVDTTDKAKKLQGGAPRLQKNGGVEKTGILLQSTDGVVASGLGPGHSGKRKRRRCKRTTTGAPEKPLEKAEVSKLKENSVDTRHEVRLQHDCHSPPVSA